MPPSRIESFARLWKRIQAGSDEAFWVLAGQLSVAGAAVIGVRLLTQYMTPATYGQLALAMTGVGLINQLLLGPISSSAMRQYGAARTQDELTALENAVVRVSLEVTGVVTVGVCLAFFVAPLTFKQWLQFVVPAAVYALFHGYNATFNGFQKAARNRRIVAVHQTLEQLGRYLIACGLVVIVANQAWAALLGFSMASIVTLISQSFAYRKYIWTGTTNKCSPETLRTWRYKLWSFGWPFVVWGGFTWAQQVSDRWALQLFVGENEVGLYNVLFQLGYYPVTLLGGALTSLIAPVFYDWVEETKNESGLRRATRTNVVVTVGLGGICCILVLLTAALHSELFALLVGPQFRTYSHLLPLTVAGGSLFACGQVLSVVFLTQYETRRLLVPNLVGASASVVLNVSLTYFYGAIGTAWALVCGGSIYLLVIVASMRIFIGRRS